MFSFDSILLIKMGIKQIKTKKNIVIALVIVVVISLLLLVLFVRKYSQPTTPLATIPEAEPKVVSFCLPNFLKVTSQAAKKSGAYEGLITFLNISQSPCSLIGYPDIKVQDGPNTVLVTTNFHAKFPERIRDLKPNQRSYARFIWKNWCGQKPTGPLSLSLMLPQGQKIGIVPITIIGGSPLQDTPDCQTSNSTISTIQLRPISDR